MSKEKEYLQSNVGMFEFGLRKWKLLLGVAILAGIMSIVFSGPSFIQPKFSSTAVIYPTNLGEYGSETVLEQMQQYLQSDVIRNTIIEKYNLYEEYEIDKDYPKAPAYMKLAFEENFEFTETRFQSIKITVSSTNPERAKKMADEVISLLNTVIHKSQKVKLKQVMLSKKYEVEAMKSRIDSLKELLTMYSEEHGVLDFPRQTEKLMEGYMQSLLSAKKNKKIELLYENLKKYGYKAYQASKLIEQLDEYYAEKISDYAETKANYHRKMDYTYELVSPEVPTLKTYPIRWLISFIAVVSATLFTFVLLLILGYKKNK